MCKFKKEDSEKVINSKVKKKNKDILNYWTEDQMEKAKPVDIIVQKTKDLKKPDKKISKEEQNE